MKTLHTLFLTLIFCVLMPAVATAQGWGAPARHVDPCQQAYDEIMSLGPLISSHVQRGNAVSAEAAEIVRQGNAMVYNYPPSPWRANQLFQMRTAYNRLAQDYRLLESQYYVMVQRYGYFNSYLSTSCSTSEGGLEDNSPSAPYTGGNLQIPDFQDPQNGAPGQDVPF